MRVTYNDLLDFNKKLLSYTGEPFGVVNKENLESALGVQTYPYEYEEQIAASLLRSLITAHGFINGNKRTAVVAMARVKEIPSNCTDEKLIDLVYKIASEGGSKISVNYISNYIYGTNLKEEIKHTKHSPSAEEIQVELREDLNNYSPAERACLNKLLKKYPNMVIPEIDKKTGNLIYPYGTTDGWDSVESTNDQGIEYPITDSRDAEDNDYYKELYMKQALAEEEMKKIICTMIDKYDASEEETFDELQSITPDISRDLVSRLYKMCNNNHVEENISQNEFNELWEELENLEE